MKICKNCLETKPLSSFYTHKGMKDGHINVCIECKKKYEQDAKNYIKYDKTQKGVIRVIYKTQISNSKQRNHEKPSYTKDELASWLYINGFEDLYKNWVASGYLKDMKPSVDRLNDYLPYSIDNIRLTTWKANREKQYSDTVAANSTSGEKCKTTKQYSLETGELLNTFISEAEAGRQLGISNKSISACCLGKRKSYYGYKFTF